MEYHCTKATDVAMRIFEKGLDTFPDEVEFALRYLGFLISINDDASESPSLLSLRILVASPLIIDTLLPFAFCLLPVTFFILGISKLQPLSVYPGGQQFKSLMY